MKSAKSFYDQFFENDFIVQRALIRDPSMNIGEVDIQSCNVYEREHYRSSQNYKDLFSKSLQKFEDPNLSQELFTN